MRGERMLYYGKKLVIFMISVGLLSLVTFYVSRLAPGDPLFSYYGERVEKMSPEEREWAEEKLGLNDKISVQYSRWIHQVFHGNFGRSYKYKMDVLDVLKSRLGNTLLLGGTGFLIIFAGALLLGVICAWKEGGWLDKIICKAGTIISCVPEFWLALVLILVFSVSLRWLPSSGAYAVGQEKNISDRILHMILPLTVIVTEHLWYYGYMVRNKMLDEIRADYVLLAKAKGIKKSRIMLVHCMRNIMPSYLSIMAISVTHIMGGTYVAAFCDVTGKDSRYRKNISNLFPEIDASALPCKKEETDVQIFYNENDYQAHLQKLSMGDLNEEVSIVDIPQEGNYLIALYLFDNTELNYYIRQNQEQKMVAGLIYLDNYDEVLESVEEVRRSLLLALIDRKISKAGGLKILLQLFGEIV